MMVNNILYKILKSNISLLNIFVGVTTTYTIFYGFSSALPNYFLQKKISTTFDLNIKTLNILACLKRKIIFLLQEKNQSKREAMISDLLPLYDKLITNLTLLPKEQKIEKHLNNSRKEQHILTNNYDSNQKFMDFFCEIFGSEKVWRKEKNKEKSEINIPSISKLKEILKSSLQSPYIKCKEKRRFYSISIISIFILIINIIIFLI